MTRAQLSEETVGQTDTFGDGHPTDQLAGKFVMFGAGAGTMAGGLAGFLIGMVAFAILSLGGGPGIGAGIWALTLIGAVAGAIVGAVIGTEFASGLTQPDWYPQWAYGGGVRVGVSADHWHDSDQATERLTANKGRLERMDAMPYETTADLPDAVKRSLPKHAQEIYLAAYNNAWEQYADPKKRRHGGSHEETAYRVAWTAVKQEYRKQNGKWVPTNG